MPAGAGSWGSNQLSSAIPPSGSFLVYNMPPDTYDVRCIWTPSGDASGTGYVVDSHSVTETT
ncbi:MAG TPA: hypothetical protein VF912_04965 [Anaeromyxobacter sp.]